MHNQRLHTTETREELYQPVKTRPSETFHARMLMVWSMSAGTLIFFILVLGSALGLEYPAPRPPLLVLAVFYVTAAPIAYYLSLIHISEPTRRTPISYAVFCLK